LPQTVVAVDVPVVVNVVVPVLDCVDVAVVVAEEAAEADIVEDAVLV